MYMTKLVDRPIIRGAARLLDIGGVLAWRGAGDPADASARLMDEAWAMFGVALKDALPASRPGRTARPRLRRRITPAARVMQDADAVPNDVRSAASSWPLRNNTIAKVLEARTAPKSSTAWETDAALRRYLTEFGKLVQDDGHEIKALFFISAGYTNEDMDALAGEAGVNNDPASAGQLG